MNENIKKISSQILELLQTDSSVRTAWQIKLKLALSASALYMALGVLVAEGKIDIAQQSLDYKINLK